MKVCMDMGRSMLHSLMLSSHELLRNMSRLLRFQLTEQHCSRGQRGLSGQLCTQAACAQGWYGIIRYVDGCSGAG